MSKPISKAMSVMSLWMDGGMNSVYVYVWMYVWENGKWNDYEKWNLDEKKEQETRRLVITCIHSQTF